MNKIISCWSCSNTWEFVHPLSRSESCDKCGWDAKVCKNCQFYDASAYRECREEQAELVKDKDKRNFCTWFESKQSQGTVESTPSVNPLDQLFGNSSTPSKKSKLEEEMDAFFKK